MANQYYSASLVFVACLFVGISFTVTCLKQKSLRVDPGRWTQLVAVLAMMGRVAIGFVEDIVDLGTISFLLLVCDALEHLTLFGIALTLIERLIGVCKRDPNKPGFSRRLASLLIAGSIVVAIVFVVAAWYGTGGNQCDQDEEGKHCAYSPDALFINSITYQVLAAIEFILALALSITLCIARRGSEDPYPLDRVLPIVVSVLVVFILFLFELSMADLADMLFWRLRVLAYTIMVAIWLFAEAEVRKAYRTIFCPCCPGTSATDGRPVMLDAKSSEP